MASGVSVNRFRLQGRLLCLDAQKVLGLSRNVQSESYYIHPCIVVLAVEAETRHKGTRSEVEGRGWAIAKVGGRSTLASDLRTNTPASTVDSQLQLVLGEAREVIGGLSLVKFFQGFKRR